MNIPLQKAGRWLDDLSPTDTTEAGPLAVATHSLCKQFGSKAALRGLDLSVPHGSVYVLVGPNGAGKTTTLGILMDLLVADRGTAEIFGMDSHREAARVRAQVGYLPERQAVPYDWLTVAELLRFHAGYFREWDSGYAGELMDLFSVDRESRFGGLSKGEQRRVQLVMTLAHRPPLLLLDEPTDGLDPVAREKALSALAAHLARFQTTVLLSTHHVHEAERLGDHLGVIEGGALVVQLGREALRQRLLRYRLRAQEVVEDSRVADLTVLQREEFGHERAWIVWGDQGAVRERIVDAGFEIVAVDTLTLAESALVLLGVHSSAGRGETGNRTSDQERTPNDRSPATPTQRRA